MKKLILLLLLILPMGLSSALTNITTCQTLSSTDTYVLLNDLNSTGSNNCLVIQANNTIIDGNGFEINKSSGSGGVGVLADGFDNLTIKNLTVTSDYDISISIEGSSSEHDSGVVYIRNSNIDIVSARGYDNTTGTCSSGSSGGEIFLYETQFSSLLDASGGSGTYDPFDFDCLVNPVPDDSGNPGGVHIEGIDINLSSKIINISNGNPLSGDSSPLLNITYNNSFEDESALYKGNGGELYINKINKVLVFFNSITFATRDDLDNHVFDSNLIIILSAILDRSAQVTFFNLPQNFTHPIILKNGSFECLDCVNSTSLNAQNVTFSVQGFDNYSISSDIVSPRISFIEPTNESGTVFNNNNNLTINVSSEDFNFQNITINIYNETSIIQSNSSNSKNLSVTYIDLSNGIYFVNATARDPLNSGSTETRNFTINISMIGTSVTSTTGERDSGRVPETESFFIIFLIIIISFFIIILLYHKNSTF